jgi:C-terminal processing protease CtpA/Prc
MRIVLCFSFIFSLACAQKPIVKDTLSDKTLLKDSAIADFKILYELSNTIHPGQFMFCNKPDFDKCYDSLQKSIQSDLSIIDFYKKTALLLAKIKDGHTAADRGNVTSLMKNRLVIPFSIYKISQNYYISKVGNKAYEKYLGRKIVKINNVSIETIVANIIPYLHLEGRNETGINIRLINFPVYYFLNDQSKDFKIEWIDKTGKTNTAKMNGVAYSDFTKNVSTNIAPLSDSLIGNKVAVLKVHSFENGYNEKDRLEAEKMLDAFFSKIQKSKIPHLILDLRDNGGGAPEIANYLFSYLIDKPYYYFDYVGAKFSSTKDWKQLALYPENIQDIDTLETKFKNGLYRYAATDSADYWWFEQQQNKANYFKGKLSVMIDGGCFSTTGHLLALLREYKLGTFYGEYSQGSNYSNSGGQAFVLPYSKALMWIPTFQYKMHTPNFKYDSKGIAPDIELLKTQQDFESKTDRQLDALMETILKK